MRWAINKITDIYDVRDGTHDSPKYVNKGHPLITSKNLKNNQVNYDKVKFISNEDYKHINKRSRVDVGDVLFAMIGTIGNPVVINKEPDFAIKNVALFKPKENQNSNFLRYYLESNKTISKMQSEAKGTTQKFVGLGYLRNFLIPTPPLSEQNQIVETLDKAFEKIDKAIANVERNIENAEELFKSYLQNIFENKGQNWEEKTLGKVCKIIGGGTPSKKREDFYEGNILWATVRDMKSEIIKNTQHKITTDAVKNSSTNIIPKGNVIIATRVGLGKVCLLEKDSAINQDLKAVIPKKDTMLSIPFLFRWFTSISEKIINEGTGATVQGVKLTFINSLQISIPPIKEQKEIVIKLDALSIETKKLKAIYTQKIADLEELKKSILEKAFKGELTIAA